MVVSEARIESWNPTMALKLAPLVTLDDDQLFAFCQLNRDLRIERDAQGVLLLMAPAGGMSSARNLELCREARAADVDSAHNLQVISTKSFICRGVGRGKRASLAT